MKTLRQVELEIESKVRAEMIDFIRNHQDEPYDEDIWEELPPIKPTPMNYDMYSDYPEFFDINIGDDYEL